MKIHEWTLKLVHPQKRPVRYNLLMKNELIENWFQSLEESQENYDTFISRGHTPAEKSLIERERDRGVESVRGIKRFLTPGGLDDEFKELLLRSGCMRSSFAPRRQKKTPPSRLIIPHVFIIIMYRYGYFRPDIRFSHVVHIYGHMSNLLLCNCCYRESIELVFF
jgi:hypothetical protein